MPINTVYLKHKKQHNKGEYNGHGNYRSMYRSIVNHHSRWRIEMDKLIDSIIIGGCILAIIAGSIFGAWAMLQTI